MALGGWPGSLDVGRNLWSVCEGVVGCISLFASEEDIHEGMQRCQNSWSYEINSKGFPIVVLYLCGYLTCV